MLLTMPLNRVFRLRLALPWWLNCLPPSGDDWTVPPSYHTELCKTAEANLARSPLSLSLEESQRSKRIVNRPLLVRVG